MATTVQNPFDTQQLGATNPLPGSAVAPPTPAQVSITPDQTVEGRTAGIIAGNSPLMQLAETRANQQANSRGLINSSMAVNAGQTAVMDQATKIAGQDAATSANAAVANAQATNQFGLVDKNVQADITKMQTGQALDAKTAETKFGYDKAITSIQAENNKQIASMEAQYKNLTQASASASSIINSVSAQTARIMENPQLDAAAKQKAIDIYSSNANKALQMIGAISGDVDLMSFFDEVLQ
jgi:hypothetical protein